MENENDLVSQERMLNALLHHEAALINLTFATRLARVPHESADVLNASRERSIQRLLAWHDYMMKCAKNRFYGRELFNLKAPEGLCFPYTQQGVAAFLKGVSVEGDEKAEEDLLDEIVQAMCIAMVIGWESGNAFSVILRERAPLLRFLRKQRNTN